MEKTFNPDHFEIASATFKIFKNPSTHSHGMSIYKCNSFFSKLTGFAADRDTDVLIPSFRENSEEYISSFAGILKKNKNEIIILTFSDTQKSLYTVISPESPDLLNLISFDFTSFQEQLNAYRFQEIGYKHYIENFHGLAFQRLLKPEVKSVFTAGAYEEITGYTNEQARDVKTWMEIIHPEDLKRVEREAVSLYSDPGYNKELEYRIIRNDGEILWIRSYDCHLHSIDGNMQMVQGLIVDVTNQKEQELKLQQANKIIKEQNGKLEELSLTDYLTGLSNRRSVQQVLNYLIHDYKRTGESFSVLMMDLDYFKKINDKYGHDGGDAVLKGISKILKENLRAVDIKSRWGGEEFLILLPRTNVEEADKIAWKLLRKVRSTIFEHNKINIQVTFSGGVATYGKAISLQSLLKEADRALYTAKDNGRNQIFFKSII